MRDLTIALSQSMPKRKTKTNLFHWNLALLVFTVVLALTYLFTINSLSTDGFKIRTLEQQFGTLEAVNKNLEMQVSDLTSVTRIQLQAVNSNFVPVTNVTFIKDDNFALK